jgi:hypothetical protein
MEEENENEIAKPILKDLEFTQFLIGYSKISLYFLNQSMLYNSILSYKLVLEEMVHISVYQ